jgi:hypothetical protein
VSAGHFENAQTQIKIKARGGTAIANDQNPENPILEVMRHKGSPTNTYKNSTGQRP